MTARLRELNDAFRRTFAGGRVVMTAGIATLAPALIIKIIDGVNSFDGFDPDNDPHGEHDFGTLVVDGEHICWKVDYYDRALQFHSRDASDPAVTVRVLTILLTAEY